MKPKNKAAVALGKLAAGKAKTLSPQERERRRQSLAHARTFIKRNKKTL